MQIGNDSIIADIILDEVPHRGIIGIDVLESQISLDLKEFLGVKKLKND